MQVNKIKTPYFKGYDAAPLKSLYMGTTKKRALFNELKDTISKEGIDLYYIKNDGEIENKIVQPAEIHSYKNYKDIRRYELIKEIDLMQENKLTYINFWVQDNLFFAQIDDKEYVIPKDKNTPMETLGEMISDSIEGPAEKNIFSLELTKNFNKKEIEVLRNVGDIKGGNFFVGKKEDGEKWLLIGMNNKREAKKFAKILKIKEENIFVVPQYAFHLDMRIRPVGYPYILVSDEETSQENNTKANNILTQEEIKQGYTNIESYISGKEIAKELEKYGFKPILIGGNYAKNINFMNAIVHKREDGSLIYITNSSKNYKNKKYEEFEKIFEKELKEKMPQVKEVHFVEGEVSSNGTTMISEYLENLHGGIHCLCAEEPNFDIWT